MLWQLLVVMPWLLFSSSYEYKTNSLKHQEIIQAELEETVQLLWASALGINIIYIDYCTDCVS